MTYSLYTEHMDEEKRAEFDAMLLGEDAAPVAAAPKAKSENVESLMLAFQMRK